MKRTVTILLAALLLLSLLAACGGGDSKYVGTYRVTRLADWTIEEYADLLGVSVEEAQNFMKIELKAGGKAVFTSDDDVDECTWKVDGDKLTLVADGEELVGTIQDKVITLDLDGEILELTRN